MLGVFDVSGMASMILPRCAALVLCPLVLSCIFVFAGGGMAENSRDSERSPEEIANYVRAHGQVMGAGVDYLTTSGDAALELSGLRSFRNPREAVDQLPTDVRAYGEEFATSVTEDDRPLFEESRRVFGDKGSHGASLYIVPTKSRALLTILSTTDGPVGAAYDRTSAFGLILHFSRVDSGTMLAYGVAEDDVATVDLIHGDTHDPLISGEGVLFFEFSPRELEQPAYVKVTRADGSDWELLLPLVA
jgi:hypothetical protein